MTIFAQIPTPPGMDPVSQWAITLAAMAGAATMICQVILQLMARWEAERARAEAKQAAEKAALAVAQVKYDLAAQNSTLDQKLEEIAAVGEMTHALANSAMLEQKRLLAVTARAKAVITQDRVDIAAAEEAERHYEEHKKKQEAMQNASP